MKILKISFFIMLCYMQGFSQIYVSPTGDDIVGTGSSTSPYKTIIKGVQSVPTGGTVFVSSGNYPATGPIFINKPLTIQKDGVDDVVIDASGWTSTDTYVLGIVNTSGVTIDGLTIANKIGNGSKGIWVLANSSAQASLNNITITNCKITNIGWISHDLSSPPENSSIVANAIKIDGGNGTHSITNVSITNNKVFNCATGWGEGITLTGNINGFTVANNFVYDIANIGIVAAGNYTSTGATSNNQARNGVISQNEVFDCMSAIANSAGIYLDGALNCTITRNEVYLCGVGISVGAEQNTASGNGGSATGHIINNNSIYNNVITGAIFGGAATEGYTTFLENTKIYNNNFYNNRTGAIVNGVDAIGEMPVSAIADNFGGEVHFQNSTGITFKNNIVYASDNKKALLFSSGYTVNDFVSDYNLYYREGNTDGIFNITGISLNNNEVTKGSFNLKEFAVEIKQDVNSLVGLPGFTNPSIFDFSLITGALATDKGDPSYSALNSGTIDFDGDLRKRNNRIDIGNSELQTGAKKQIEDTLLTNNKNVTTSVSPNPTSEKININFAKNVDHTVISIVDLNGRLLFKQEYSSIKIAAVDINELKVKSQIVFVEIKLGKETYNHKIYIK